MEKLKKVFRAWKLALVKTGYFSIIRGVVVLGSVLLIYWLFWTLSLSLGWRSSTDWSWQTALAIDLPLVAFFFVLTLIQYWEVVGGYIIRPVVGVFLGILGFYLVGLFIHNVSSAPIGFSFDGKWYSFRHEMNNLSNLLLAYFRLYQGFDWAIAMLLGITSGVASWHLVLKH